MRGDWKDEARRFEDIDKAVMRKIDAEQEKFTCDWCHKEYTMGQFGRTVTYKEADFKGRVDQCCIFCEDHLDNEPDYEPWDHEAEESGDES